MDIDPQRLSIVKYPHPVLRQRAKPVENIDESIRALASRMIELMHQANGVGLAAPQVAVPLRLFVANWTGEPGHDVVYVNPTLRDPDPQPDDYDEGCLSLPGITATIRRPIGITIHAHDLQGHPFTDTSHELAARVWQHETDHLDGVLIIDLMKSADKRAAKRQLKQLEAEYSGPPAG